MLVEILAEFSLVKNSQDGEKILQQARELIAERGPDQYFQLDNVPLHARLSHSPASISKGYTITCYVRVQEIVKGRANLFSFIADSGAGVQAFIVEDEIEIRAPNSSSQANVQEFEGSKFEFKIKPGKWYFLAFTHVCSNTPNNRNRKGSSPGNMSLMVNAKPISTLSVPFPPNYIEDMSWTLLLGGYSGDLGPIHAFGSPLTTQQILCIYESSPTYSPRFLFHRSFDLARYPVCPGVSSGLIQGTFFRITAKNCLNGYAFSESWVQCLKNLPMNNHHKSMNNITFKVPEEAKCVVLSNHRKILITKGGLKIIFFLLSPMNNRPFYSANEAADIFRLIMDLIDESPSLLYQLNKFGVGSLKQYFLREVPQDFRGMVLLEGVLDFIYKVESMMEYNSFAAEIFIDSFKYFLCDFSYWSNPEQIMMQTQNDQLLTIKNICSIIGSIIQTQSSNVNFRRDVSPSFILNIFRTACRYLTFENPSIDTDFFSMLSELIRSCSLLLVNDDDISLDFLEDLGYVIYDIKQPKVKLELFRLLLDCAYKNPQNFASTYLPPTSFGSVFEKRRSGGLVRIFIDHLNCELQSVQIYSIKLLSALIMSANIKKRQFVLAEEICSAIEIVLQKLPVSSDTFTALLEMSLGNSKMNNIKSLMDDSNIIRFPCVIILLLRLAQDSCIDCAIQEKVLFDILGLLKINFNNITELISYDLWHIELCSFLRFYDSSRETINQLAMEIYFSIIWHSLRSELNGWILFDQSLFSLLEASKNNLKGFSEFKIRLGMQLLIRLKEETLEDTFGQSSKSANSESIIKFFSNVKMLLLLFEKWIFLSDESFLVANREPSDAEISFVLRFYEVVNRFSSTDEKRMLSLRINLRFVMNVIHQSYFLQYFEDYFAVIGDTLLQFFAGSSPSIENIRILKVAIFVLLRAHENILDQSSSALVQNLIDALVNVAKSYNLSIFNEENIRSVSLPFVTEGERIFFQFHEKFLELLESRHGKVAEKIMSEKEHHYSRNKETKRKSSESYFAPLSDKFGGSILRFETIVAELWKKESQQLYESGKALKHFSVDFITKSLLRKEIRTPLFWKLDRTHNFYFQRHILRANVKGHDYSKNSNRGSSISGEANIQIYELAKSGALDAALVSDSTPEIEDTDKSDNVLQFNDFADIKNSGIGSKSSDEIDSKKKSLSSGRDARRRFSSVSSDYYGASDTENLVKQSSSEIVLFSTQCTLITPLKLVDGKFTLTSKEIIFKGERFKDVISCGENIFNAEKISWSDLNNSDASVEDVSDKSQTCYGIFGLKKMKIITISLDTIRFFLPRKYLLRESALEFFLKDFKGFLFNFEKPRRNEAFFAVSEALKITPELKNRKRLKQSGITEMWKNKEISNFHYLMLLNIFAGRSFNDITQYPVFPWIIKDYSSEELDLSNPEIYRDLSKPIGALNEDRKHMYLEKFKETSGSELPPWHYGSHYSSAGIVLYYLIRLEPFTALNANFQGGKFDLPDRLFVSMKGAWDLSYSNVADVKELIPEFFYLPEFLLNLNGLSLGEKQDKTIVGDVILPPWAKSVHQFIQIQKDALESDYVSQHLHEWIDLVFGYKQRGLAAIKAQNVFFHLTYEGSVDVDAITDSVVRKATESQIINFGQTPSQLFREPHVSKNMSVFSKSLSFPFQYPVNYKALLIHQYNPVELEGSNFIRLTSDQRLIHAVHKDEVGTVIFLYTMKTTLDDIMRLSQSKELSKFENFSAISTISEDTFDEVRSSLSVSKPLNLGPPMHILEGLNASVVTLSKNGSLLFSAGYQNCSIRANYVDSGTPIASTIGHCEPVTCMSIIADQTSIVSGASDGSITLWISQSKSSDENSWPPLVNDDSYIFSDHSSAVIDVSHSSNIGIIASISSDGTCNTYSLYRQRFIRSIDFDESFQPKKVLVSDYGRIIVYGKKVSSKMCIIYNVFSRIMPQRFCCIR
jgi:hypothetical protein